MSILELGTLQAELGAMGIQSSLPSLPSEMAGRVIPVTPDSGESAGHVIPATPVVI